MKTTLLLAVFVAIISQFMADEAKAWSGWLHKKIRRRAVAKLPAECRDRYDEEWESGVEEVPGDIFKIFYSIGLLWAAFGIRKAAPKGAVNSENASALFKRTFDMGRGGPWGHLQDFLFHRPVMGSFRNSQGRPERCCKFRECFSSF